ncbi:hypothetical protein C8Q76DRAFT_688185 [Earliella scabrosa]|nr:hypothetical protein C8Q76DRAFT_688185 [Earliella scabrosa]
MATEAPANVWLEKQDVVFAASESAYALNESGDWTQAYICIIGFEKERYGLLICETLECKFAPNPTVAQVGLVLDENIVMKPDPDAMVVSLRVTSAPSLISLVPLDSAYTVVSLRFEERMDYLSCVKAVNDAEIAVLADREEKIFTMRRALSTIVPRHASPGQPQPCELHGQVQPEATQEVAADD